MMERENRYLVLKRKDIKRGLFPHYVETLFNIADMVAASRANRGAPPLKCVVVESDWPEYEPVWKMISDRVDGAAPVSAELVNARLLDALNDLVSASVNEASCQRGVVEKCHCVQCSRIRAREAITAAEQAKHAPELTDERILELWNGWHSGIIDFTRQIERELREEWK